MHAKWRLFATLNLEIWIVAPNIVICMFKSEGFIFTSYKWRFYFNFVFVHYRHIIYWKFFFDVSIFLYRQDQYDMMIVIPPVFDDVIFREMFLFGASRFDPTKLPTFSTNLTVRCQEKQDPDIDQGILEDIEDLSDSSDDGLSALNASVRKNFRLPKSKLNIQEEKILKDLDKKRQSIEEPGNVINFWFEFD